MLGRLLVELTEVVALSSAMPGRHANNAKVVDMISKDGWIAIRFERIIEFSFWNISVGTKNSSIARQSSVHKAQFRINELSQNKCRKWVEKLFG